MGQNFDDYPDFQQKARGAIKLGETLYLKDCKFLAKTLSTTLVDQHNNNYFIGFLFLLEIVFIKIFNIQTSCEKTTYPFPFFLDSAFNVESFDCPTFSFHFMFGFKLNCSWFQVLFGFSLLQSFMQFFNINLK